VRLPPAESDDDDLEILSSPAKVKKGAEVSKKRKESPGLVSKVTETVPVTSQLERLFGGVIIPDGELTFVESPVNGKPVVYLQLPNHITMATILKNAKMTKKE
jgi:hypothetical protein